MMPSVNMRWTSKMTSINADILQENPIGDKYISDDIISWYHAINYGMIKPLKWQIPLLKVLNYAEMGKVSRIMVSAPPQHGKTVLICDAFTSWHMVNNPNDKVILTAYSQTRATKYGVKIRDIINHFGKESRFKPQLKQDHKLKTNFMFESPYTGELLASGSHGAIMGNPANLIVIDDPIKELADARSPTMQENLEDWYLGSIDTRLRKRANNKPPILIVVAQRLHQRDLQGIILENEPSIDGKDALNLLADGETIPHGEWVYMNFPALSLGESLDILGRPANTPLWSNHKDYEDLLLDKKRKGSYRFEMIMQGNPTREEDYIFKHEWFYNDDSYSDESLRCVIPYVDGMDDYLEKHRFWDLAGSSNAPTKSNDFYCGTLIGRDDSKDMLFVFDMKRSKRQALGVLEVIRETLHEDTDLVTTVIEQEAGSHSNLFFEQMYQEYPNHRIEKYRPKESKLFRSYELKRLAENQSLKFVVKDGESMNWIHTIIHELESFDGKDSTSNKHDDIVDSLSMGANYLKENNHILFGYIDL